MYKLLQYSNDKWEKIIEKDDLDIYFSPNYLKIWEDYGDGETQAFFYESSAGKILYPYLIREIDFSETNKKYFDISTPYGYGGPVLLKFDKNNIPELVNEFRSEFNDYASQKGIVSEFIRFHPIDENYKYFISSDIKCEFVRNTIKISLDFEDKKMLKNMSLNHRRNIKKALRNELEIQFYNIQNAKLIKDFYKVYLSTMKRLNTSDYYFFFVRIYEQYF